MDQQQPAAAFISIVHVFPGVDNNILYCAVRDVSVAHAFMQKKGAAADDAFYFLALPTGVHDPIDFGSICPSVDVGGMLDDAMSAAGYLLKRVDTKYESVASPVYQVADEKMAEARGVLLVTFRGRARHLTLLQSLLSAASRALPIALRGYFRPRMGLRAGRVCANAGAIVHAVFGIRGVDGVSPMWLAQKHIASFGRDVDALVASIVRSPLTEPLLAQIELNALPEHASRSVSPLYLINQFLRGLRASPLAAPIGEEMHVDDAFRQIKIAGGGGTVDVYYFNMATLCGGSYTLPMNATAEDLAQAKSPLRALPAVHKGYTRLFHGTDAVSVASVLNGIDSHHFANTHIDFGPAFYTSTTPHYPLFIARTTAEHVPQAVHIAVVVFDVPTVHLETPYHLEGDEWRTAIYHSRGVETLGPRHPMRSVLSESGILSGHILGNADEVTRSTGPCELLPWCPNEGSPPALQLAFKVDAHKWLQPWAYKYDNGKLRPIVRVAIVDVTNDARPTVSLS